MPGAKITLIFKIPIPPFCCAGAILFSVKSHLHRWLNY
nr:MAG TPA: hypothetical protein [Caudoviricetes sp.]